MLKKVRCFFLVSVGQHGNHIPRHHVFHLDVAVGDDELTQIYDPFEAVSRVEDVQVIGLFGEWLARPQ